MHGHGVVSEVIIYQSQRAGSVRNVSKNFVFELFMSYILKQN